MGVYAGGPYVDQSSSWTYDAFGNRLSEINPVANTSATFTPASNQITATSGTAVFVYDAAGNVTYDGLNHYLYDAEGRVCAVSNFVGTIAGYIYDAAGIRVAKVNLNQFSCNLGYGYTTTSSYVCPAIPRKQSDQRQELAPQLNCTPVQTFPRL